MLHFQRGTSDPRDFWPVVPTAFAAATQTDLFIGRNIFKILVKLKLAEIATNYVIVDILRVPRETFAAVITAWRDGYAESIGQLTPITEESAIVYFNHDDVFLYSSGAAGLPFIPGNQKDHINEHRSELSRMEGKSALQLALRSLLLQTESILQTLPAIVQANGIDALIIDTVQLYAELGAMQLGIPYLHCAR